MALFLLVLCSILVPIDVKAQGPGVYIVSPQDGKAYNSTSVLAAWEITSGPEPVNRSEYSLDEGPFIDVGNGTQVLFENTKGALEKRLRFHEFPGDLFTESLGP